MYLSWLTQMTRKKQFFDVLGLHGPDHGQIAILLKSCNWAWTFPWSCSTEVYMPLEVFLVQVSSDQWNKEPIYVHLVEVIRDLSKCNTERDITKNLNSWGVLQLGLGLERKKICTECSTLSCPCVKDCIDMMYQNISVLFVHYSLDTHNRSLSQE